MSTAITGTDSAGTGPASAGTADAGTVDADATILRKVGTADAVDAEPIGEDGRFHRSLREVREVAYRALMASGASHGEAVAAAEAVQHAEAHHGTGVAALVADLASGPWPRTGLRCARSGSRISVSAADSADGCSGPLRAGQSLIDFAAGEAGTTGAAEAAAQDDIVFDGSLAGAAPALLDAPLLAAATAVGRALLIIDRSERSFAVRCATPDGRLGSAPPEDARAAGAVRDAGSEHTVLATLAAAGIPIPEHDASLIVALGSGEADADAAGEFAEALEWTTADERTADRHEVAVHGLHVDAEAWRALKRVARGYLQPDREETS